MKSLFTLLCLWIISEFGNAQGVGIGTTTPHAPLQFANLTANRKIVLWEIENNDHRFYGLGINGGALRYQVSDTLNQHIFYAGVNSSSSKELMRITGRGNVGIGTTTPHAPLQFDAAHANRKIVLAENMNNDHSFYGFGTELFALRYQVAAPVANHIFYAASGNSSVELMRITGSGRVGIVAPEPFEQLEVGGTGRAFFGNGGSDNRKGLLIDGIEGTNAARIEAFDYQNNTGRNLIINTSGGGKVGIGTVSPTEKLHVAGNVRIDGNLQEDSLIMNEDFTVVTEFLNGFQNLNLPNVRPCSYYKDKQGIVHLAGTVISPGNQGDHTIFILPQSYTPPFSMRFIVPNAGGYCRANVYGGSGGEVTVYESEAGTIDLDGIKFRVDQ